MIILHLFPELLTLEREHKNVVVLCMVTFANRPSDVEFALWLKRRVCFRVPDLALDHAGRLRDGLDPTQHAVATKGDLHTAHILRCKLRSMLLITASQGFAKGAKSWD